MQDCESVRKDEKQKLSPGSSPPAGNGLTVGKSLRHLPEWLTKGAWAASRHHL